MDASYALLVATIGQQMFGLGQGGLISGLDLYLQECIWDVFIEGWPYEGFHCGKVLRYYSCRSLPTTSVATYTRSSDLYLAQSCSLHYSCYVLEQVIQDCMLATHVYACYISALDMHKTADQVVKPL